jgi:hypothetical protein
VSADMGYVRGSLQGREQGRRMGAGWGIVGGAIGHSLSIVGAHGLVEGGANGSMVVHPGGHSRPFIDGGDGPLWPFIDPGGEHCGH